MMLIRQCLAAPAALLAAAGLATAAPSPPSTPQAFAAQLVALYATPAHSREEGNAWDAWYETLYDPAFHKLMDENRELAGRLGENNLDDDPLCGCQTGSEALHIVSVASRPGGLAEVKATHCEASSGCTDLDLIIKRIGGSWRFYDAVQRGGLRRRLARENACMRRAKTVAAGKACLAG